MESSNISSLVDSWLALASSLSTSDQHDSRRIFHGRGGCYAGLNWICVDLFHPVIVITVFDLPDPDLPSYIVSQWQDSFAEAGIEAVLLQQRHLPDAPTTTIWGNAPKSIVAQRGDLRFHLNFQQQNIGYFLDMEPGRAWLEGRVEGKRVLNLFSYTCAFSVVAAAAGATSVVNVDMSKRALGMGRDNHRLNRLSLARIEFWPLNILKSWGRLIRKGPYDVIIIDPPSRQLGSFEAAKDYQKIVRRLPELSVPGTEILACLNAPTLDNRFLESLFEQCDLNAEYMGRLESNPDFPDATPDRALKLLHYRVN